jgi:hypothetical protein
MVLRLVRGMVLCQYRNRHFFGDFPMHEGYLQPRQCYKVDTRGLITGETQVASVKFFNTPGMMHVVVLQDSGISAALRPWTIDVTTREVPIHLEYRIIFWARQMWHIMSMYQQDFCSLVVHLDDTGYELSNTLSPAENETGHLEMFPFCSPYLRSLQKQLSEDENR